MKQTLLLFLTFLYFIAGYSQFPEGFEGAAVSVPNGFPSGWLVTDNGVGTSTSWEITNNPTVLINGTKSAIMNRHEIGSGNTSEDWLISPSATIPTNGQLKFFTRQSLAGENGTLYQIRVSSGNSQSNLSSYTVLQQWTESQLNQIYNIPEQKVVNFPVSTYGTNVYFAFVRVYTQPTASQGGDRWLIDDINVAQKCLAPIGLTTNNITATSATFSWNASAESVGYDLEILPATAQATGAVTHTSATNVFQATGLSPNTCYKYYVRSNCGNGDYSDWIGPLNLCTFAFGSSCGEPIVISTLPYQTTDNTGNYANNLAGPQSASCISGGVNYQSGNDVFYSYTAAENCSVSFTLDPTQTRSSMFIYPSCTGLTGPCLAGIGNTNASPRILNYEVTAGSTYIIVISSHAATPTVGYNLLIQCQNCPNLPTNLTASNSTLTGVNLAWTAPIGAPVLSYEVAVQPSGSLVPTGSGQYTSVTPNLVVNDLTAATPYQYWVRSECSEGEFSAWVGPYFFNTQICSPSDECTYTFRVTDSANNGWNGARMQVRQNGVLLATLGSTFNFGGGPIDLSLALCDNVPFDIFWSIAGTQPQQCIVSIINSFGQTIDTIVGSAVSPGTSIYQGIVNCTTPLCNFAPIDVTFSSITTTGATINWNAPATENIGFDIYIVPAGSGTPVATTTPSYSGVNGASAPFSSIIPGSLSLLPDTLYDVYVRIQCDTSSAPWSAVSTFKTDPTCPKPINQTVTGITNSSAILGWTEAGSATQWEVLLLAAPNAIEPTTPENTSTVGTLDIYIQNITGATTVTPTLAPATIYYYYVRSVCQPGNDASTWSGPFIFNTITCDAVDKCNYRFILTNTTNNNWNGGRIQVRQNGIVVATLGTGGINNANGVSVALCNNVPYDLFWNIEGSFPGGIGVEVQNPFSDIVYTKLPGQGTPLTVLFEDVTLGNCALPSCPKPTALLVNSVAQTTADLSWTEEGSATAWEVYVVAEAEVQPVNNLILNTGIAGYYAANTNTNFVVTGLTSGTQYKYYVRAVCSSSDISTWTLLNPKSFITTPLNDDCSQAISVPVNPTQVIAQTVSGNTLGATASTEISDCPGSENDDVWFKFLATNTVHIVSLTDIVGSTANLRYAVYSGTDCGTMTQIFCSPTNVNSSILSDLIVGTTYKIRVYTNANNPNQWASFSLAITTTPLITNDECATATPASVNEGLDCIVVTPGSITGATASPESNYCANVTDKDVWFSFVATASTHIVKLQNIVGTSTLLYSAVFSGEDCGSLTLLSCLSPTQIMVQNLTVGNTYKVRVWSISSIVENIQFDLCIATTTPPITVSTTQYTKPQLITDVLIKSTCASISNITWFTGTTPSTNGIGYFNKGQSNFPFEDGIVLVTGSATAAVGPNSSTLSSGVVGSGDADLAAILAAQTPPQIGALQNATKLEFDFVALTNQIHFNFMFASEEYGEFQCAFSDAFAFILTDLTAATPSVNLAVIPGTTSPVSVVNIRDNQYNSACQSSNVQYFGNYYNDAAGILSAPINFNGITVPMTASSAVIPGNTYHIKMVIADFNDSSYDSAVFLEGGSFDIGNIQLPEDYLIDGGNAVCAGDILSLNSQLDSNFYTIQWYNGENLIVGETSPILDVSESGTYSIQATYIGTTCTSTESITVEYFTDVDAVVPADLIVSGTSGQGLFDLIATASTILSPFPANTHEVVYFLTIEDALSNNLTNALSSANAQAYLGVDGQQIFVRVNSLTSSCFQIVSFNLIVDALGTGSFDVNNLVVYPNPANEMVTIQLKNSFETLQKITIYDVIGKQIKTVSGNGTQQSTINVGELSDGVYMIEIITENNLKQIRKFIVH